MRKIEIGLVYCPKTPCFFVVNFAHIAVGHFERTHTLTLLCGCARIMNVNRNRTEWSLNETLSAEFTFNCILVSSQKKSFTEINSNKTFLHFSSD